MAAIKSTSLSDICVNRVVSNELIDTNTYLLTCENPITLIGADYNGTE